MAGELTEPAYADLLIAEAWERRRRRRRLLLVVVALAAAAIWGAAHFQIGLGHSRAAARAPLVLKVDFRTEPQATPREEARVADALRASAGVSGYRFISKGEALATMRKKEPTLIGHLQYNPLPDSYEASLVAPSYARAIERRLRSLPGVQVVLAGHVTR